MAAKDFTLPMGRSEIEKFIPHREPMVMIDEIVEVELNKRLVAYKKAANLEIFLKGHFPGNPVVPGVLMIEGMAQAAAVLCSMSDEKGCTVCYLLEVNETRFKKLVRPEDTLRYEVVETRSRGFFHWYDCHALVNNEEVASTKISAQMR